MNIQENKSGKTYVEVKGGSVKVGDVLTARRMNRQTSRWDEVSFRVTGLGKIFEKKTSEYVVDEDANHDGQRKVSTRTEEIQYAYGEVK